MDGSIVVEREGGRGAGPGELSPTPPARPPARVAGPRRRGSHASSPGRKPWKYQTFGENVVAMSTYVQGIHRKRGTPGDSEDARQDAALWMLEQHAAGKVDEARNPQAYLITNAIRKSELRAVRMASVLTFGRDSVAKQARGQWLHWSPLSGSRRESSKDPRGGESVDVSVRHDAESRADARALIYSHVERMPARKRAFLRVLFGIDQGDVSSFSPKFAKQAVAELCSRLKSDPSAA